MAHAVPLGLSHIGLPKEFYVTVAVPVGFEMQGQPTKTIWHTLRHWDCQKKFDKRSLCNTRCASAIRDIEAFTESYMAHAVPLGLSKKVSQKKSV